MVLTYLAAAFIGSAIPRNADWQPSGDVGIMVETNGLHTGIVMPIVTAEMDWRTVFPDLDQPLNGELPTHIAVGWGEREVFLHVAQWDDLSPVTALRVATVGGDALLRVAPYVRPAPSENYRPIMLSSAGYTRMSRAIAASLQPPPPGGLVPLRGSYGRDLYFPAQGHYSPLHTCNVWVGDRLADGGLPMGSWTPFAGGVMQWIPYGIF